jgi:hypothetical protein
VLSTDATRVPCLQELNGQLQDQAQSNAQSADAVEKLREELAAERRRTEELVVAKDAQVTARAEAEKALEDERSRTWELESKVEVSPVAAVVGARVPSSRAGACAAGALH